MNKWMNEEFLYLPSHAAKKSQDSQTLLRFPDYTEFNSRYLPMLVTNIILYYT